MNAQTTASGKKNPAALPAFMPATFTFGATPTIPIPLLAAAIVPAVCVPWPLSSCAARPGTGAPLDAVDAVRHVDVLAQVRVIEVDSGIDVADEHGRASARDRVRLRRVDLPHVPLERRKRVRVGRGRVRKVALRRARRVGVAAGSWNAKPSVAEAFSTFAFRSRLSRNDGFVELATTTPICG